MSWIAWLVGAAALFFVGAYFLRIGKTRIIKLYAICCVALLLMALTDFGLMFGTSFASWPGAILSVLAPATLILAVLGVQRDRAAVMGRPEDRDAPTTAAVIYGASGVHGAGGGADGNDAGGGMEV